MIRDLLRRLRRPAAGTPEPVVEPRQPPPSGCVGASALLWWRRAGVPVVCVDLRGVHDLRYGIVQGAMLLPEGAMHLWPQDGVVVSVGAHPRAGWWTQSLQAWEQADYPMREPAWKAPLPLLHPVCTASGARGWVQDVDWVGHEFRMSVLLEDGRRVDGLTEEELSSRGPRGAAGLGEQR